MARISAEDCLKFVENRYELVLVATRRARQLLKGSDPLIRSKNRIPVTALREIASGQVRSTLGKPKKNADAPEEEFPLAELNELN